MSTPLAYSQNLVTVYDQRHFGGASGRFILSRDLGALTDLLPPPGSHILDAPCGTGVYLAALRQSGYRVTGVDASAPMLALSNRQAGDAPPLYRCDINRLPFVDSTFDAAISLRFFSHFPLEQLAPTLRELRRVVKPGGRIVFDTFAWSPRQWPLFNRVLDSRYMIPASRRQVTALIRNSGLQVAARRDMYLFSPIWQRKLPFAVVRGLASLEKVLPGQLLLRTFWSCGQA